MLMKGDFWSLCTVTFGPSAHGDTPPPLRHADVLNGWSYFIWLPIRPNNSNTRQKGNMFNASSARIHITKNMTMRWKTVGIVALFNAVHLKMFVDIVAMSSCEKRVRFRRFWNYLKKRWLIVNTCTVTDCYMIIQGPLKKWTEHSRNSHLMNIQA